MKPNQDKPGKLTENRLIQVGHGDLMDRVVSILEQARANVARSVNSNMVIAYWLIGREVVVALQGGEDRAEYGERLLGELSGKLTKRFGRGFSMTNLRYFRLFYQAFSDRAPEIHHSTSDELGASAQEAVLDDLTKALEKTHRRKGFSPDLSWTHYRALSKIDDSGERLFYEIETEKSGWSVATLERQIHSFLFARLLKSRDKVGVLALADQGQTVHQPIDVIKQPYVLDFLNLPEQTRLHESDVELAIIENLQPFLLELGKGFAFVGRQYRVPQNRNTFSLIWFFTIFCSNALCSLISKSVGWNIRTWGRWTCICECLTILGVGKMTIRLWA